MKLITLCMAAILSLSSMTAGAQSLKDILGGLAGSMTGSSDSTSTSGGLGALGSILRKCSGQ